MINYKYGVIIKDDLVSTNTPFLVPHDALVEDLYLLSHKNGEWALDIGWYEKEDGGCFTIYILKNKNWDKPIYQMDTYDPNLIEQEFYKALNLFNELIEKEHPTHFKT